MRFTVRFTISCALVALHAVSGAALAAAGAHPSAPAPRVAVGDSWTYQYTDVWKGQPGNLNRISVVGADAQGVEAEVRRVAGNALVARQRFTPEMNPVERGKMHFAPSFMRYAFPLEPGKQWSGASAAENLDAGKRWRFQVTGTAGEWEQITVAAGQFDAIKIEVVGYYQIDVVNQRGGGGRLKETLWYAPAVQNFVKLQYEDTDAQGQVFNRDAWELTAFARKLP